MTTLKEDIVRDLSMRLEGVNDRMTVIMDAASKSEQLLADRLDAASLMEAAKASIHRAKVAYRLDATDDHLDAIRVAHDVWGKAYRSMTEATIAYDRAVTETNLFTSIW